MCLRVANTRSEKKSNYLMRNITQKYKQMRTHNNMKRVSEANNGSITITQLSIETRNTCVLPIVEMLS